MLTGMLVGFGIVGVLFYASNGPKPGLTEAAALCRDTCRVLGGGMFVVSVSTLIGSMFNG